MTKEERIEDMKRMYESLTNPDIIEKNRREEERKKRKEDKVKDTGL